MAASATLRIFSRSSTVIGRGFSSAPAGAPHRTAASSAHPAHTIALVRISSLLARRALAPAASAGYCTASETPPGAHRPLPESAMLPGALRRVLVVTLWTAALAGQPALAAGKPAAGKP